MKKKFVGIVLGVCVSIALVGCSKKQSEDVSNRVKCEEYATNIYNGLSDSDYKDNCNVFYSESDNVIKIELNDIYDDYSNYLKMNRDVLYFEFWGSFAYNVNSLCKTYKDNIQDLNLNCDVVIEVSNNDKVFYTSTNGNYKKVFVAESLSQYLK